MRKEFDQMRTGRRGGGISTINPKEDNYYDDAQSCASFSKLISNYDGDAPFYREVGLFSPHLPFITQHKYKTMYPLHRFQYPPEWETGFDRGLYSDANVRRNFKTQ